MTNADEYTCSGCGRAIPCRHCPEGTLTVQEQRLGSFDAAKWLRNIFDTNGDCCSICPSGCIYADDYRFIQAAETLEKLQTIKTQLETLINDPDRVLIDISEIKALLN